MICYRDMTFCDFWKNCRGADDCHRALTPEVRAAAAKWWGSDDVPIAEFVNRPECWVDVTEVE